MIQNLSKIKYHNNIYGQQYGTDGELTDNWNSEPIYGNNEYSRVFFRIDCPSYVFNNYAYPNWDSEEQKKSFYAEARDILKRFNIPEGTEHFPEKLPGMEHLHVHPQNISGVIAKNRIKAVAEALNACSGFSVRWVDVYEDIADMTNEAFIERLNEHKGEIEADLLECFKTKRRNLYIVSNYWNSPVEKLSNKYTIRRRTSESGVDEVCMGFIKSVFDSLVEQRKIVSAKTKNGIGYRAAKKDELKET